MVIVDIINGDILNAKEKYICHQCNCVSKTSYGLSKAISSKYLWADLYKLRQNKEPNKPGTIIEFQHPTDENLHNVICFIAQIGPKKPNSYTKKYLDIYRDKYENRIKWFQECLSLLDEKNYDKVAMPYGIGCGLAGGVWCDYHKILHECKTQIVLYKL